MAASAWQRHPSKWIHSWRDHDLFNCRAQFNGSAVMTIDRHNAGGDMRSTRPRWSDSSRGQALGGVAIDDDTKSPMSRPIGDGTCRSKYTAAPATRPISSGCRIAQRRDRLNAWDGGSTLRSYRLHS
jgi:hypothetical protein